jgi:hypothetical protein
MLVIQLWRGGHLDLGPYSEIPKAKTAGGITQVIDHLPSKCKGLSSNLSTGGKKEESAEPQQGNSKSGRNNLHQQ